MFHELRSALLSEYRDQNLACILKHLVMTPFITKERSGKDMKTFETFDIRARSPIQVFIGRFGDLWTKRLR